VVDSELNTAQLSGAEGAASEVRHLSRPRLAIRRRCVVAVSAHPPYLLAGIHGCLPAPVTSMTSGTNAHQVPPRTARCGRRRVTNAAGIATTWRVPCTDGAGVSAAPHWLSGPAQGRRCVTAR